VLHTRPQGGKQVGDLVVTVVVARLLALLDRERLSPGRLGLDELLELDLVVVLVLLRLEIPVIRTRPRPRWRCSSSAPPGTTAATWPTSSPSP